MGWKDERVNSVRTLVIDPNETFGCCLDSVQAGFLYSTKVGEGNSTLLLY